MMILRKIIPTLVLTLLVWVTVSWLFDLPPFEPEVYPSLEHSTATKPFPTKVPFRFGSRALSGICDEYRLNEANIIQKMKALGVSAKPEWAIKRIAEENDMEVPALFDVIRQLATN